MISSINKIITRLPGNKALIQKTNDDQFSPNSQKEQTIQQLKSRDKEVRLHEASHMSSGGVINMGGPSYTYQLGPDGKAYAIGGQVTLATTPSSDPKEAIQKAEALKNAALSVDKPSTQDLAAASSASQMKSEIENSIKPESLNSYPRIDYYA